MNKEKEKMNIELMKNVGYVFLHGDLTDPKTGICDIHAKKARYKKLQLEERELITLLRAYMLEIDNSKVAGNIAEIKELLQQVEQVPVQRLLFGLFLLERYQLLNGANKFRMMKLKRLIQYIFDNMEQDENLSNELRIKLIRNTSRMIDAIEIYLQTNECVDISMPLTAWLRTIKLKSMSHQKIEQRTPKKFSDLDGFTISKFAKMVGVNKAKLLKMEKEKILIPERDEKNRRIYSREDLELFKS
jgi:DNA-binding transcriptional MerR regulator